MDFEDEDMDDYKESLAQSFDLEWDMLCEADKDRVALDFALAVREDHIGSTEYRGRIGSGNLTSYANCLRAGEARRI